MNKRLLIIVCALLTLVPFAKAQGLKDIKINEVLVNNVDSYEDDFGVRVSWIELYNSGYASVNVSGAFLRYISEGDTISYKIPANDARTLIPAQGYTIFFADGSSNKGTFYTSFNMNDTLATGTQIIEVVDQSGRKVMDSFSYSMDDQCPDVSYGRLRDHITGEVSFEHLGHITPMQANEMEEPIKKSEVFLSEDPAGVAMAVTAMSVVFSALLILFLLFKLVGNLNQKSAAKKKSNTATPVATKVDAPKKGHISGEEIAAIAVALRLYEDDLHDIESNVVTINKVARAYSPWSSKIYNIRETPNKKTW